MKIRTRRSRSVQFEFMERRETLSGVSGAAAIVAGIRLDSSVSQFQLIASGTASGQFTPPHGPPSMLAIVQGEATLLGPFHGQILVEQARGSNTAIAMAYLIGTNGTTLSMTIEAIGNGGGDNGRQPQPAIRGRFWITGGTGALSGATGTGTIAVDTSQNNGDFVIEMQGQITV